MLGIQTDGQHEMLQRFGHRLMAMDATHNTTHYENISLFTVLVHDTHGHGVPIAWLLSSNATEETIDYFLALLLNTESHPSKILHD